MSRKSQLPSFGGAISNKVDFYKTLAPKVTGADMMELSTKSSKLAPTNSDMNAYERLVILEKLRNASPTPGPKQQSPGQKKYHPQNKQIQALKNEINRMTIAEANNDDLPMKSAIPQEILENPYYALILNSVGSTGTQAEDKQ